MVGLERLLRARFGDQHGGALPGAADADPGNPGPHQPTPTNPGQVQRVIGVRVEQAPGAQAEQGGANVGAGEYAHLAPLEVRHLPEIARLLGTDELAEAALVFESEGGRWAGTERRPGAGAYSHLTLPVWKLPDVAAALSLEDFGEAAEFYESEGGRWVGFLDHYAGAV